MRKEPNMFFKQSVNDLIYNLFHINRPFVSTTNEFISERSVCQYPFCNGHPFGNTTDSLWLVFQVHRHLFLDRNVFGCIHHFQVKFVLFLFRTIVYLHYRMHVSDLFGHLFPWFPPKTFSPPRNPSVGHFIWLLVGYRTPRRGPSRSKQLGEKFLGFSVIFH